MDIRNTIRVDAIARTNDLGRAAGHLDRLGQSMDRVAAAQTRLARGARSQRDLLGLGSGTTAADRLRTTVERTAQVISTRMRTAMRTVEERIAAAVSTARTGLGSVGEAAAGAARRTTEMFQRLRSALPRIDIGPITSSLRTATATITSGIARMVTAARAGAVAIGRAFASIRPAVPRFDDLLTSARFQRVGTVAGARTPNLSLLNRDLQRLIFNSTNASTAFGRAIQNISGLSGGAVTRLDAMSRAGFRLVGGIGAITRAVQRMNFITAGSGLFGSSVGGGRGAGLAFLLSNLRQVQVAAQGIRSLVGGLGGALAGGLGGIGRGGGGFFAGLLGGAGAVPPAFGRIGAAAAVMGIAVRTAALGATAAVRNLGAMASGVGNTMSTAFTAGGLAIGAIAYLGVRAGASFEQAMNKTFALADVSEEQFASLTAQVNELSRTVPIAATDLAAGLYFIVSAGIPAADAMDVLRVTSMAAAAAQADLATVADAVTSAFVVYRNEGYNAARITDIITKAVILGKTEFDTFAGSIGRVLPLGHEAGLSFEEIAASLSVMTTAGLSADEAATAMRAALANLVAPAAETKEALATLGYTAEELRAAIADRGFVAVFSELYDAVDGNIDLLDQIIPNIRGLTGALILAGPQAQQYADVLAQVEAAHDGAGATAEAFARSQGTLVNKLRFLRGELSYFGRLIFLALEAPIKATVDAVEGFVSSINDWINANPKLFQSIVRTTAAIGGLSIALFGIPTLLAQASIFLGFFGAFGLGSFRARSTFEGLAAVLKVGLPLFGLAGLAAFGLAQVFDVDLSPAIAGVGTHAGAVFDSIGRIAATLPTLFRQGIRIFEADPESALGPLERIRILVGAWRDEIRRDWYELTYELSRLGEVPGRVARRLESEIAVPLANVGRLIGEVGPVIGAAIGDMLSDIVESGARLGSGLIEGFIQIAPSLGERLNAIRTAVLDWVIRTVPQIASQMDDWIEAFLGWAREVGPQLVRGLLNLAGLLVSWIAAEAPRLVNALSEWTASFVTWVVTDLIPDLLSALSAMVSELTAWLGDTRIIQQIAAALATWTVEFTVWVLTDLAPALTAAFVSVVAQLTTFLVTQGLPLAGALIGGMVEGIAQGFDQLDPVLRNFVGFIGLALVPAFMKWTAAALGPARAMTATLLLSVRNMIAALLGLVQTILTRVVTSFLAWRDASNRVAIAMGVGGPLQTAVAGANVRLGAGGFLGSLGGLIGRIPVLGGLIGGLGPIITKLVGWIPGIGQALIAGFVIWETNFLGLRDIAENTFQALINAGAGFIDWLRGNPPNLEEWAAGLSPENIEFQAARDAFTALRDEFDSLFDAGRGRLLDLDLGEAFDPVSFDELRTEIDSVGERFGVLQSVARNAFVDIMRSDPHGGVVSWLDDLELRLQGRATSFEIESGRIAAVMRLFKDNGPVYEQQREAARALREATQIETNLSIAAWQKYDSEVRAALDRTRNALFSTESDINTSLTRLNEVIGPKLLGFEVEPVDLTGLLKQEQIDLLQARFDQLEGVDTTGWAVGAVEALELARQDLLDQITIMSTGLDRIAIETGGDIELMLAEYQRQIAAGLSVEDAMAEVRRQLEAGLLGVVVKVEIEPVITVVKPITPEVRDAALARLFEFEPGFNPTLSGENIGGEIGTGLTNSVETVVAAAKAVGAGIAGILKIQSEPTNPASPLAGITRWGLNIAATIFASLVGGMGLLLAGGMLLANSFSIGLRLGLMRVAATVQAMLVPVAIAFLLYVGPAFVWGRATGLAYARGLRSAAGAAAAAAVTVARNAAAILMANSPPGPQSPLHEIGNWGYRTMMAWVDGIMAAKDRVAEAARDVAAVAANEMTAGLTISTTGQVSAGFGNAQYQGIALAGGGSVPSGMDPEVVGLLEQLVTEQQRSNELTARGVSHDPRAAGPLTSRGTLAQVQAQIPVRRN